jgi:hypothetical protein
MGLLPEISGKLERVFDAHLSPKTPPVFLTDEQRADTDAFHDERTTAQKRHDVFAALIDAAGRDPATPTVAGLPATVLVSAKADDLNTGHGVGWIDGIDEPIPMRTIKQFACNGGIQNGFFTSSGDLIALESPQRIEHPRERSSLGAGVAATIHWIVAPSSSAPARGGYPGVTLDRDPRPCESDSP